MTKTYSKTTNLCYAIVGVAMHLQNRLGVDHSEDVYDPMYLADLRKAGFKVTDKPRLEVIDAFGEVIKVYRPDFRVSRNGISVLVEIKSDPDGLRSSYDRQAGAYLHVSPKDRVALLINFAIKPLQHKIISRKKQRDASSS